MVSNRRIESFSVYLVKLDPAVGVEMKKIRPCVVVSPEAIHRHVGTVMIAPLTTQLHRFPFRIACRFDGRDGEIALDQMRAVDRSRLLKRIGDLDMATVARVCAALVKLFA